MARWIWCKHPIHPDERVALNLDQIASIWPVRGGSEVYYAGSEQPLLIAHSPDAILKNEDFDSAEGA